jgi:putative transposase
MPARNLIREYAPDSYYHIYNRGVEKRKIFLDKQDYATFLSILRRHLDPKPQEDRYGRKFENYSDELELLAFCLMPNHFHLLMYQHQDSEAFSKFLWRVGTAYTIYFNKKYKRVGHLFQGSFKAKRIDDDAYLQHISRYIHLNPKEYTSYEWSSLPYYSGNSQAGWIKPEKILELFKDTGDYLKFVKDYRGYKATLDEIKDSLANY